MKRSFSCLDTRFISDVSIEPWNPFVLVVFRQVLIFYLPGNRDQQKSLGPGFLETFQQVLQCCQRCWRREGTALTWLENGTSASVLGNTLQTGENDMYDDKYPTWTRNDKLLSVLFNKLFQHKQGKNIKWKLTSFFSGVDLTPFMDLTWECLTTSPMWGTNTRVTTSTKTKKFSSMQAAGLKQILDVCTHPSQKPGTAPTSMGRRLWGS